MCGNGTCQSCREAARDNSHSFRWRPKFRKLQKGTGDQGSEVRTDWLDMRYVQYLVDQQQDGEGGKKGKEQE
jgi:hypothetical protein